MTRTKIICAKATVLLATLPMLVVAALIEVYVSPHVLGLLI